MHRFLRAVVPLLAAALFLGCAVNLEEAVVGRYRAEVDLSGVPAEDRQQAQMAGAMMNGISVEFRKDKTVEVRGAGRSLNGRWGIQEGRIQIQFDAGGKFPDLRPEEGVQRLVPVFTEDELAGMKGARIWLKRE